MTDRPDRSRAARAALPPAPSEGCRVFRERIADQSLAHVAREIGSKNKTNVNDVLHGYKQPSLAMRASIEVVYAIPRDAWARYPEPPAQSVAAVAPPAPAPANGKGHTLAPAAAPDVGPPLPTLDHCLEVLRGIRQARSAPDLVSSERVKLAEAETKVLALRARLEMQSELSEHRIVRAHPEWHRIKRLLARALRPHPAAMRDVANALQEDLES